MSSSGSQSGADLIAAFWASVWDLSDANFLIAAISAAEMTPGGGVGVRSRCAPCCSCSGGLSSVGGVGGGGRTGRGWCSMTIGAGPWVGWVTGQLSAIAVLAGASVGGGATQGMALPDQRDCGSWFVPALECGREAFPQRLGDIRFLGGFREPSSLAELERE